MCLLTSEMSRCSKMWQLERFLTKMWRFVTLWPKKKKKNATWWLKYFGAIVDESFPQHVVAHALNPPNGPRTSLHGMFRTSCRQLDASPVRWAQKPHDHRQQPQSEEPISDERSVGWRCRLSGLAGVTSESITPQSMSEKKKCIHFGVNTPTGAHALAGSAGASEMSV